jgi:hypothetical protein
VQSKHHKHNFPSKKVLKGIVSETHSVTGLSHAKVQRARNIVKNQIHNDNIDAYTNIPNLCAETKKFNPGSRLCCQVDSENTFYRLFMVLPSCITTLDACIPCLEVDATFMKHPSYNGTFILVNISALTSGTIM